ncbi:MAG TPA: hypothetical protein GXZ59_06405 [Clostridiaceae bacterium]|nr:hypothetical protein [Clostridiaceae bacterium]
MKHSGKLFAFTLFILLFSFSVTVQAFSVTVQASSATVAAEDWDDDSEVAALISVVVCRHFSDRESVETAAAAGGTAKPALDDAAYAQSEAAAAVKQAEEDLTRASIEKAQALIDELPEGRERDELQEHLNIIQEVRAEYTDMLEGGDSRRSMIVYAVFLVLGGLVIIFALRSSGSEKTNK